MPLLQFKALADETRLRLIRILFHYELSVNELVRIMGMGQSRVSRHLKILTEAGLLRSRRDGLWVFYSVPPSGENSAFLSAIQPFFPENATTLADMEMAARMLEERVSRARQFFNAVAEKWDDLNHEILGDFDLPARVSAAMPKDCRVAVDLGCGTGEVLAAMRGKAALSIGVDASAAMLERCRSRMAKNEFAAGEFSLRIGELSHLPLADHEANFACINLVLHHLPQPEEAFGEMRRILAPGGILFLSDFLRHEDESMRRRYGDYWLGFDEKQLRDFFEANGFSLCSSENRVVGRKLKLYMMLAQIH